MEIGSIKASAPGASGRVFELTGGHPALDLVNTLDWRFRESGPEEFLQGYADVIRFTEQTGLLSATDGRKLLRAVPTNKAVKVVAAIRELREAVAEALYAVVDGKSAENSVLKRLEEFFKDARQQHELKWEGGKILWTLESNSALPVLPLWILSFSIEALMTSEQMDLLRECGNAECRWLFLDTSKNHTRRWCDMKICGNRMKARRFKEQHRA